jgi:hypothetical protein
MEPGGTPGTELPSVSGSSCLTCVYFRAFTEEERRDARSVVKGDGWCYADPPKLGVLQDRLGTARVEPVRPPTFARDVCRHWNPELAGDAVYACADALDKSAERLDRIAELMRELVQTGVKS